MQKPFVFILIALLFTACADLNKSEQLERIERMESEIIEWNEGLESFDDQTWKDRLLEAESTIAQLKQLESDTISLQDALSIDNYRNLQLDMIAVNTLHVQCAEGMKVIELQLTKLKTDIDSGNGQRHKYDDFITEEEAQMKILREYYALYRSTSVKIENELPDNQEQVNRIIAERLTEEEVQ